MSTVSRAFITTWLTVQVVGLCAGAPCVALYRYHGSTISYAPGAAIGLVVFGSVITLIPALFYAWILTAVIRFGLSRNWSRWALCLVSAGIMALLFFAFVSLTSRPIPDLAMYFRQEAPSVRRPALSMSEIPLLAISLAAGVLGALACIRVLSRGIPRKDLRHETSVA
jgi:hypothetical protein